MTKELVQKLVKEFLGSQQCCPKLLTAGELFLEIISLRYFPDFITTYLNDHAIFKHSETTVLQLQQKL